MMQEIGWIAGIGIALWAFGRVRAARPDAGSAGWVPPPGRGTDEDVLRLMRGGRKISAIKVYRDVHGVGLKDAKEAVERMPIEV